MPDLDFIVRVDDTANEIRSTLRDELGAVVNLTGATVRFRMRPAAGDAPTPLTVDATATIENAAGGVVSYAWVAPSTHTPGLYIAEWRVTFPDTTVESFPNGGVLYVLVSEGLTGTSRVYASLAELRGLLRLKGNDHDAALAIAVEAASRAIDARTSRRFWADPVGSTIVRYFTPVAQSYCKIDDLITLTGIVDAGGTTLVQGTDFQLEPANAAADSRPYDTLRVVRPAGWGWPEAWQEPGYAGGAGFQRGRRLAVTGRWGWPTVPGQIRNATAILAGQLFLRPQQAVFGVVGLGFEGEGQAIPRFDPHVESMIAPFIRPGMIE